MMKENHLVKVNDEMFVDAAVIDKLVIDVRALKSKNPKLGVAEFKALTGVTRKHAIPLLEFLDRQRITRRMGDERLIL
jgi:selenocysteine-specific elongation factor